MIAFMIGRPHIDRLEWDDWNRAHIAKHAVKPIEAEEVVAGQSLVRETYKQRLQLVGPTMEGRMLTVVIGPVPGQAGVYYVFSARPASRQERKLFEIEKGKLTP
jgi:uncharacterized DUF497 family protein